MDPSENDFYDYKGADLNYQGFVEFRKKFLIECTLNALACLQVA